jgi:farnesyl-diphosphate farnesyltransferase
MISSYKYIQGGKDEKDRELLIHFDKVISEYILLSAPFQQAIEEITRNMGNGMAEFLEKPIETIEDYNSYCHYVAGLVGIGLSRLFVISKLEDEAIANIEAMANTMGLFLQKTNIIRDFYEDFQQGRVFWPKQLWSLHVENLSEFCKNPSLGVNCLNELILDVLESVPTCLHYLSMLKNPAVFRFCAIPQVMAIATLALCFNNPDVFRRHVKIRRGTAIRLIMNSTSIQDIKALYVEFVNVIARNVNVQDPHQYIQVQLAIGKIKAQCIEPGIKIRTISRMSLWPFSVAIFSLFLAIFIYAYLNSFFG